MAGLGFKDFQVGEVLTSADVDGYLMQQTVMRFADSGARGSALGTAAGTGVPLAEGMVSYLQDTDTLEFYDGSVWGPVSPPPRPFEVGGESANTSMSPSTSRNVTFTFTVGRFTKAPVVAPSYFHGNLSYFGPRLTGAAGTASVTFEVQNASAASQNSRLWYIAIEED